MERDFMGVGRKEPQATGTGKGRLPDVDSPAVNLSGSSRQAKTTGGGLCDLRPSSGLMSFPGARRSYAEMKQKQRFGTGLQSFQGRQLPSYTPWSTGYSDKYPSRGSDTVASAYGRFVIGTGAPPIAAATRKATTRPTDSQMTIFYGGRVNVFDSIPTEKAREIMVLAANGSNTPLNPQLKRRGQKAAPGRMVGGHLSPESVTSPSSAFPANYRFTDGAEEALVLCLVGASSQNSLIPAPGSATHRDLFSGAVPLARKVSLTRFLERRKERISRTAPYLSGEKSVEVGMDADLSSYYGVVPGSRGGQFMCPGPIGEAPSAAKSLLMRTSKKILLADADNN